MNDITNEKDLVIGAIDNLTFGNVEKWLYSLQASGYKGDICLIAYRVTVEDLTKFLQHGVDIIKLDLDQKFSMANRFFEMWRNIGKLETEKNVRYRYIITTDVRDVKFQINPVRWLHNEDYHGLVVATENMTYENEPWSKSNMQMVFGTDVYNRMKTRPIVCAGVIAGKRKYVLDMMLSIALTCNGLPDVINGGGGPDQAALNVLLTAQPWGEATIIETPLSNGIIHLGTTWPAIEKGRGEIGFQYVNGIIRKEQIKFYIDAQPKLVDGMWVNPYGRPYAIVHQYDRAE